ncbi:Ig-like domain-containing protein [Roseomonas sp. OT10]|uniref:Ig-like domain-containing protein n=1 Tax=Roseomonas cutis TaxID=2897332 RepID=UPI001E65743B|nr:Ig-like domain-containing protein [Roseomonas sp. OT10]UFN50388.1 Ig-like domain-containing protein [Roseomonas sp. OT10]
MASAAALANAAPMAADDAFDIRPDVVTFLPVEDLLANDSDPDGDPLTVVGATLSTGSTGSVELTPEGIYYIGDFSAGASLSTIVYTVADPAGLTSSAVIQIRYGLPDLPALELTVAEDSRVFVTSYVIALGGGTTYTQPAHGETTQEGNPDYTREQFIFYTPDPDYNGTDSFYLSFGAFGGPQQRTPVVITVTPVPDAPVAAADSVSTAFGTPLTLSAALLLANDTDADGDSLAVTGVGGATHGSVALAGGTITFTPAAGFSGTASFTYTVGDGTGLSDTATVTVSVGAGSPAYLRGTASADLFDRSTATDRVLIAGLDGDDTLRGGAAADALNGGAGNDVLNGGGGNDLITGGQGADRMAGGGGNDTFAIARGELGATNATDHIVDFQGAGVAGGDVIRLSGFGPGATLDLVGSTGNALVYEVHAGGEALGRLLVSSGGVALAAGDYAFV